MVAIYAMAFWAVYASAAVIPRSKDQCKKKTKTVTSSTSEVPKYQDTTTSSISVPVYTTSSISVPVYQTSTTATETTTSSASVPTYSSQTTAAETTTTSSASAPTYTATETTTSSSTSTSASTSASETTTASSSSSSASETTSKSKTKTGTKTKTNTKDTSSSTATSASATTTSSSSASTTSATITSATMTTPSVTTMETKTKKTKAPKTTTTSSSSSSSSTTPTTTSTTVSTTTTTTAETCSPTIISCLDADYLTNFYRPGPAAGNNVGTNGHDQYTCFYGGAANFPSIDRWEDYNEMFEFLNATELSQWPSNTPQDVQDIKDAISQVSAESNVDERVILAMIIKESSGNLAVNCTYNGVENCGLMQSYQGVSFDPAHPKKSILQMIRDGTEQTCTGPGMVALLNNDALTSHNLWNALRAYNSGKVNYDDLNDAEGATASYVMDIANYLLGWQGYGSAQDFDSCIAAQPTSS